MKLGFPGGAPMRGEAWILPRLAPSVHGPLALRKLPPCGPRCGGPVGPGRNPVPYMKGEEWDWRGPKELEPSFARRRARHLASMNIPQGAVVLDLSGGLSSMITELPKGGRLILADVTERTPQTKA